MIFRNILIFNFVSLLLFTGCLANQCENDIRRIDLNTSFHSVLKDLYFDENGRGVATFIFDDGTKQQTETYSMCCYGNIGDSIWKNRGSLKYYLKRANKINVFYPECGNITIKDTGTYQNRDFTMDCERRRKRGRLPLELVL